MDLTERLLQIKKQIDEAIPKQAEITGQIRSEEERIESQFGIKTIPEMEKKLNEIGKDIDNQESEFKKGMEELEAAYPWD